MAHDEYQIPHGYNESSIRAELEAIEYTQAPEREPMPFQRIKAIESQIFAVRQEKTGTEKKPNGWLSGLVFAPQNQTVQDIIEDESLIGEALFGEGHRFWLDARPAQTVYTNNVADWYHLQPNPNDPKQPIVLRFQTTPQRIHKLYMGREYEPTLQDIEVFSAAVEAYGAAVASGVQYTHKKSRYGLAA